MFAIPARQLNPSLARLQSTESEKNNKDKPNPRPKLPPNFVNKAHSKIKEARALDTDAKMYTRKFEEELIKAKKEPEKAKL